MQLDQRQLEVVQHGRGPLVVYAGAGAGKTGTLSSRFAHLVQEGFAAPSDIVAVTFTREAAGVMKERVQLMLGDDVEGLRISTMHSLAYAIRNLNGNKGRVKIMPPEIAYDYFQRAFLELGLTESQWNPEALFRQISLMKERMTGPQAFRDRVVAGSIYQETLADLYERYQQLLEEDRSLDFGDLVLGAVEILSSDSDLLAYLQALTPFVMVDEFQDTSLTQYHFIRLLAGAEQNLLVVGSPAQTIHEWRGARIGELREAFARDFPDAQEVTLKENYRSTPVIVSAAAAIGAGYPDAAQVARRETGQLIEVWRPVDQYDEAGRAAIKLLRWFDMGIPYANMAILFRTHRQADPLEAQLAASGIPYQLTGSDKLYERPEVQALLAYLNLIVSPERPGLLERVINTPPRGLGPNSVARIKGSDPRLTLEALRAAGQGHRDVPARVVQASVRFVAQLTMMRQRKGSPTSTIDAVLETTGYLEWADGLLDGYRQRQAIEQVRQDASGFDDLEAFLEYANQRAAYAADQGVHLSTIHASKGREWAAVIVVGVAEGLLPHTSALKDTKEPEEERRLLYVAMTRAKDLLVLSVPTGWVFEKGHRDMKLCRYLRDIPRDLLEVVQ